MPDRRQFLARAATATAALAAAQPALAQVAGTPVKLVFPFSAGGAGDAMTRLIAEQIGTALARPAIVENRTGADGRIGIQSVKAAPPDGDTLLVTTGPTMWLMAMVHKSPGFDPVRDFAPVAQLATFEFCVAVANAIGLKTVAELVAWAKANPDQATYGIPGAGTIPHFTGVSLAKMIGVDMRRIAYRGGVPAINDLVGGQIPIVIGTLSDALQQHRAGTVRILAVASPQRSPFVPEIATLRESGFDIVGDSWYGLWAPAGTPADRIARLNAIAAAALQRPEVRQRFETLGLVTTGTSPAHLAEVMAENARRWAPVVKDSGYAIEQ